MIPAASPGATPANPEWLPLIDATLRRAVLDVTAVLNHRLANVDDCSEAAFEVLLIEESIAVATHRLRNLVPDDLTGIYAESLARSAIAWKRLLFGPGMAAWAAAAQVLQ